MFQGPKTNLFLIIGILIIGILFYEREFSDIFHFFFRMFLQ